MTKQSKSYSLITSSILLCYMLSDKFALFIINTTVKKSFILFLMVVSSLLIIFFNKKNNTKISKKLYYYIIILFIYAFYSVLMYNHLYSQEYSIIGFFYYLLKSVLILFLIYFLLNNKLFNTYGLKVIIYFAILASISTFIYLIFVYILHLKPLISYMVDGSVQESLLIFGNFRDEFRVVYYFSEPAKYATFLVVPYFISLIFYKATDRKKYLYFSYMILLNIVLTFSFAVIFSLLLVFMIYKTVNIKKVFNRYLVYILLTLFIVIISYIIYFYFATNYFQLGGAFNKLSSFNERLEAFTVGFELFDKYPYGIGLLSWDKYDIPRGFGVIIIDNLIRGGYFYIFLYIFIIMFIVKNVISSMKDNSNYISRYYGMMLLTIFISIQIYGPLEQRVFLVSLVLYLDSLLKYKKRLLQ